MTKARKAIVARLFAAVPFLLLLLSPIGLSVSPADAQEQPAPVKIGVLDLQGVMDGSLMGKKSQEEMERLTSEKQVAITGMENEIKALQRELEQGASVLSDQAKRDKEDAMQEKIIELRRFRDDAERELENRYKRLLSDLEEKILPIIGRFGEQNSYTLILAKMQSGLVYADRSTDITPQIIVLLDATMSAAGSPAPGTGK